MQTWGQSLFAIEDHVVDQPYIANVHCGNYQSLVIPYSLKCLQVFRVHDRDVIDASLGLLCDTSFDYLSEICGISLPFLVGGFSLSKSLDDDRCLLPLIGSEQFVTGGKGE